MKKLAILGASGHGKVVAEIAELSGWQVYFFDDAYPQKKEIEGVWTVQGNGVDLYQNITSYPNCVVAIGDNVIRLQKLRELESLGANFPCLFHPKAIVSQYAKIDDGTVIMANAVINPFADVGRGCIINTAATVDHDCKVSDGVHISPGANLAGEVSVGSYSWIGIGATVKQCIQIGANVIVGAGAAVVSDIPSEVTAVGVPAKFQSQSFGKE
jgi:sugar O-acyltransferase (sialic acid O-acetyltransferase NeuD family)